MRLARIDSNVVSDIFDGPTQSELESRYPDSLFMEADETVERGWRYESGTFVNPNSTPTSQAAIPTTGELEIRLIQERDRRVQSFADDWDEFTRDNLLPLWQEEIRRLNDDLVSPDIADYPVLAGGASAQYSKAEADVTVQDLRNFAEVVNDSIKSAATFSQALTIVLRTLIAELPALTEAQRLAYDEVARFEGALSSVA